MIKNHIFKLWLVIFFWILSNLLFLTSFAANTNNINKTTNNKTITLDKKDNQWNIIWTVKLTPQDIKNLEKEEWFLKILWSIYKNNKRIFIWIITDKKIQNRLYADPINLNISSRTFYVNSGKNQFLFWAFLEKSEALNFLTNLKKWLPIIVNIESDNKVIHFTITPENFLKNKNIKYEYLFKLKKNGNKWFSLKEIITNNTDKKLFKITNSVTDYIQKKEKVVPWILWYSNTWQIILFAIMIVILIWTIIFWYLYNNFRKVK